MGAYQRNGNMETGWSSEGHLLPWRGRIPRAVWRGLGQGKSWLSPMLTTFLELSWHLYKSNLSSLRGKNSALIKKDFDLHDFFPFLLKLFSTVAGTTASQEGGEVTGKGVHLWTGFPAHGQALQQNSGLQAGHTSLSQEGLPKTLPCPFCLYSFHFPQTALFIERSTGEIRLYD